MKLLYDCIPCIVRQSIDAIRSNCEDSETMDKALEETLSLLVDYKSFRCSPEIAGEIHNIVKKHTGIADPFVERKRRDLAVAVESYPFLKDYLSEKTDDKLYWALKLAATGNNIDAAVYADVDVKKCIENELEKPFAISDVKIFSEKLSSASTLLIIGDNTGETVFDRVMIEALPENLKVYYAVRSGPIINDATEKEAIESGLDKVSHIIPSGCFTPGTITDLCSDEFMEIFNKADIVVSKGQGNYEALSDEKREIFFLLKAKCPVIAQRFSVELNGYVCKFKPEA